VSKKLSSEQSGEATVVAVRLPPDLLAGLDRAVVQASAPPYSHPSRSVVARVLIASALQTPLFPAEALNQPTSQKKEATMKKNTNAIVTEWETVTPETAAKWLQKNVGNRPVNHRHVAKLSADITAGRFQQTHQGIAFDKNGFLIDGQHRLLAIVNANSSVELLVSRGAPTRIREVIDTGFGRGVAHILAMRFGLDATQSKRASAIIHCMVGMFGNARNKIPTEEAMNLYASYSEGISWAFQFCQSLSGGGVPTPVLASLVWAHKHAPEACNYIAEKFRKPSNLPDGSPILALHSAVYKTNASGDHAARRAISLKTLRVLEAVLDKEKLAVAQATPATFGRLCKRFGLVK